MVMEGESEQQQQKKNLAKRQLDFPMDCGSCSEILPEHPQAQLQSKLLALARSRATPYPELAVKSETETEMKPIPKRQRRVGPVLQQSTVQPPPPPPVALPVVKAEPSDLQQLSNVDPKESASRKQKHCNCKNSRCLKLYCECFASGAYCNGCNCNNCHNNIENEITRKDAVEATLERNPNAFRPKITKSPPESDDGREEKADGKMLVKHKKGCNCKKSECLKKYCECFQASIPCSENCRCVDCKNFEGNEERRALFMKDNVNVMESVNQAASAAIDEVRYLSFSTSQAIKRRNNQQLMVESTSNDQCAIRIDQLQQEHSEAYSGTAAETRSIMPRSLNSRYRSLLADIIKPQDVKELCSVLVIVSAKATKTLADNCVTDKAMDISKITNSVQGSTVIDDRKASDQESAVDNLDDRKASDQESAVDNLVGNQRNSCRSDGSDFENGRAMSPDTLNLMCDEHDLTFLGTGSPPVDAVCREDSSTQSVSEVYAEQEKLVLTSFWNFLKRVITRGNTEETVYSPHKSVAETEQEHPR